MSEQEPIETTLEGLLGEELGVTHNPSQEDQVEQPEAVPVIGTDVSEQEEA